MLVFSVLPSPGFAEEKPVVKNPVVFPNPFAKQQEPISVDQQRAKQLAQQDVVAFAQDRFGQLVGTLFGFLGALSIIPIVVGGFQLMISQGGAYAEKGKKNTLLGSRWLNNRFIWISHFWVFT